MTYCTDNNYILQLQSINNGGTLENLSSYTFNIWSIRIDIITQDKPTGFNIIYKNTSISNPNTITTFKSGIYPTETSIVIIPDKTSKIKEIPYMVTLLANININNMDMSNNYISISLDNGVNGMINTVIATVVNDNIKANLVIKYVYIQNGLVYKWTIISITLILKDIN